MTQVAAVGDSVDLAAVAEIVANHAPVSEADVIPILQDAQEAYGYLPLEVVDEIARLSEIPVAKLYGVATFYAQFYLEPHGKHTVHLCRGTACHVRGAPQIYRTVSRHLGIEDGETTDDMMFSLETVACLGTCFLAPVMLIGNQYFGRLTPERAVNAVDAIRAQG